MKTGATFEPEDKPLVAACLSVMILCWAGSTILDRYEAKLEAIRNRFNIEQQLKAMGYQDDESDVHVVTPAPMEKNNEAEDHPAAYPFSPQAYAPATDAGR